MGFLLGIDLGTSSVKVGLFDCETLQLVTQSTQSYDVLHPQPGFAEQSPEAWWTAVQNAIRHTLSSIDRGDLLAIGVDGQMHGLVCMNEAGQPIGNAIIWADGRSVQEVEQLSQAHQHWTAVLPGPPSTGFAAATLLWLKKHQPTILEKTAVFLQPKDYVRYRLTEQLATDPSDASATWLFDIGQGTWANELVQQCGIRQEQLPKILPSAAVAGELASKSADALGLAAGIPIVVGGADLAVQALGHAITDPGQTFVTVGSGGQVVVPLQTPKLDSNGRTYTFAHCLPERWYQQAAMLSGGLCLEWLRQLLKLPNNSSSFNEMVAMATAVSAGSEGLLFLPYLHGERTPHMNPDASGLFFGLRSYHKTGHLVRSVLEGVAFGLKDCLQVVEDTKGPIVLSGGATRSQLWTQIMADVWQRPLHIYDIEVPRAALGSALLAGIGSGEMKSIEVTKQFMTQKQRTVHPQAAPEYETAYERYDRLYPLLEHEMSKT